MTKMTESALREDRRTSSASERLGASRLVAQWYTNAEGKLIMRWVTEPELDESRSAAALAA
jgi:hypothetical protein